MSKDIEVDNAGQIIKQMRTKHGMSLKTLADRIGSDFAYLNKMELGKVPVSLKILKRVGDVFGYDTKVKVERSSREKVELLRKGK